MPSAPPAMPLPPLPPLPPLLAVYTTVPDAASAQELAQAAIAQGLAACVQQDSVHSTYQWQGQLQSELEVRLLFKTTPAAWPALQALIARLHPYEVPAIYALPVPHASASYARWVAGQVQNQAAVNTNK